jgi:hypothetical protein
MDFAVDLKTLESIGPTSAASPAAEEGDSDFEESLLMAETRDAPSPVEPEESASPTETLETEDVDVDGEVPADAVVAEGAPELAAPPPGGEILPATEATAHELVAPVARPSAEPPVDPEPENEGARESLAVPGDAPEDGAVSGAIASDPPSDDGDPAAPRPGLEAEAVEMAEEIRVRSFEPELERASVLEPEGPTEGPKAETVLAAGEARTEGPKAVEAPPPPERPAPPRAAYETVVESVRVLARAGGGEARIELSPPDLGRVDVTVVVEDGHVAARLEVERPEVAQLLLRSSSELREELAALGLSVEDVTVESGASGEGRTPREQSRGDTNPQEHGEADEGSPVIRTYIGPDGVDVWA